MRSSNRQSTICRSYCQHWFAVLITWAISATTVLGQTEAPKKAVAEKSPPALTHYKDREIARTMHFAGAPWLIRNEREREERAAEMIKQLDIKPGQVVCDIGCGNGFHTLKMAKLVGPKGQVLAVDIQQQMLHLLKLRADKEGVKNIRPIHGLLHDPKLPAGSVDLILLVDVYHEFSHPEQMLAAMRKALKPKGRIALVEFRTEDPKVPIKILHKMSKKQIMKEFPPNGFKLVEQYDKLPWQHLMFFGRDTSVAKDGKKKK